MLLVNLTNKASSQPITSGVCSPKRFFIGIKEMRFQCFAQCTAFEKGRGRGKFSLILFKYEKIIQDHKLQS